MIKIHITKFVKGKQNIIAYEAYNQTKREVCSPVG